MILRYTTEQLKRFAPIAVSLATVDRVGDLHHVDVGRLLATDAMARSTAKHPPKRPPPPPTRPAENENTWKTFRLAVRANTCLPCPRNRGIDGYAVACDCRTCSAKNMRHYTCPDGKWPAAEAEAIREFFAQVYVITLDATPERTTAFWNRFPANWPFSGRPQAVTGINGHEEPSRTGWTGGPGAWGCYRSWMKVLDAAIDRLDRFGDDRPILVLEDDAEFSDDAAERWHRFILDLPQDWELAFPGGQHLHAQPQPVASGIVRAMSIHRTHCVMVAARFLRPLRDMWASWNYHIDHKLTEASPRHRFYAADPFFCVQSGGFSMIAWDYTGRRAFASTWAPTGQEPRGPRHDAPVPLACGGTKRFVHVGERDAFNGTTAITPHGRLCVHRAGDGNGIRYLYLDEDLSIREDRPRGDLELNRNDDPRLVWHEGRLYLSTNYWWGRWSGARMELREIRFSNDARVSVHDVAKFETIGNWPGYVKPTHEKNWAPFSHDGQLLYVHSVNPHRILRFEAGSVGLIHATQAATLPWPITDGTELRLNAPPVLLSDGSYLSTMHVRREKDYFTGFYRFAGRPPFNILAMSGAPVLGPNDSEGVCWRNGNMRLLFIQGMEVNEALDSIRLWGGDNDHSVIVSDLRLSDILRAMAPVAASSVLDSTYYQTH